MRYIQQAIVATLLFTASVSAQPSRYKWDYVTVTHAPGFSVSVDTSSVEYRFYGNRVHFWMRVAEWGRYQYYSVEIDCPTEITRVWVRGRASRWLWDATPPRQLINAFCQ